MRIIIFQQDFGGIRRIEISLLPRPDLANVYLIPQESGWILVDCGMIPPAYESVGIEWSTIREIVLTNFHPDYLAFTSKIRQFTDAPIRMPFRTNDLLNRLRATVHCLSWQDRLLHWAGFLDPTRDSVREAHAPSPPLPAGSYIEDGEVIPTALGPMHALLTPGHSSGNLCFYFAKRKLLLGSPRMEWLAEEARALADLRASLRQLQVLNVDWALPSHGRPFSASEWRIASFLDSSRELANRVGDQQKALARQLEVDPPVTV